MCLYLGFTLTLYTYFLLYTEIYIHTDIHIYINWPHEMQPSDSIEGAVHIYVYQYAVYLYTYF